MITIKMEEEDAIEALIARLKVWTTDDDVIELYRKMYDSYVYGGCFDGGELDVKNIVDNDWVNYCFIISKGDEGFEEILKEYKDNEGCGDISCGDTGYSYIEAVDNEDDPTMFLVRY